MLKQSITYEDFDGNTQTEVVHFNLTRSELAEHIEMMEELQKIEKHFKQRIEDDPEGQLGTPEIRMMLDMVKSFMKLAYGVRDGKRFIKADTEPRVWVEFTQTAAYDQFLMELFQDPGKILTFLTAIAPASIRPDVGAEMKKLESVYDTPQPTGTPLVAPAEEPLDPSQMSLAQLEAERDAYVEPDRKELVVLNRQDMALKMKQKERYQRVVAEIAGLERNL